MKELLMLPADESEALNTRRDESRREFDVSWCQIPASTNNVGARSESGRGRRRRGGAYENNDALAKEFAGWKK
jgi:hypothetical protein